MNNDIGSDGTVLTDDEAVKPPKATLMELVDRYAYLSIQADEWYPPDFDVSSIKEETKQIMKELAEVKLEIQIYVKYYARLEMKND